MKAPAICPDRLNSIRMNLPNLEELLFRTVCALPKASNIGLALNICCDKFEMCLAPDFTVGLSDVATAARYWITFLVFSVFPAPDSPLSRISASTFRQATRVCQPLTSLGYSGFLLLLQGVGKHRLPLHICVVSCPLYFFLCTC